MASLKNVEWSIPAPLRRLQRMVKKIGLEEIFPDLAHASEGELQEVVARYLYHGERHADLGISENFNLTALPVVPFTEVMNVKKKSHSPLLQPYFVAFTTYELLTSGNSDGGKVALDEPPLESDDFLGCRVFFRFVAEALEQGPRVVIIQDEKQTVAIFVHIKALRKLNTNPEIVLLQVEYNFSTRTDRCLRGGVEILQELMGMYNSASVVGTEHQIHFIHQVLEAHERLLEKTIVAEHDKEWHLRQKDIRPSFIVPLCRISPDSELHILQEISGNITPARERAPPNQDKFEVDSCAACGKKSTNLKLCSRCKSIKYCTRECQVADWKSHKKSCQSTEPPKDKKPLSGASILINPKQDTGGNDFCMTLINRHDTLDRNHKAAKPNQIPDHKEGEVYVIKAQAGPMGVLVYDRERSFVTTVVEPRGFGALTSVIRSVHAHAGLKAYFNAKNEGGRIRVYLEDLPEQRVNW